LYSFEYFFLVAMPFTQLSKLSLTKLYQSIRPRHCDYVAEKIEGKRKPTLKSQWQSCGFRPRKQAKRAARIEWEHVMPAYRFGSHMPCWKKGGRKKCGKTPAFKMKEADMHNLVPTIGEINGDRSNRRFNLIEGEERVYGDVDFEVDFKNRVVEPSPLRRGDIARIYFYMSERYDVALTPAEQVMFTQWHEADPVSEWEKTKNRRIHAIQGNYNRFIEVLSE
jgi:deoxyribonuclease-1